MQVNADGSGSDTAGRFAWTNDPNNSNRIVLNYADANNGTGVKLDLTWPENGSRDVVVVHYPDSALFADQTFYRIP